MGIILAFLLKQIFFQTITSCQVAGSALTAFSGFLPGRVPFFLLAFWSVLLFPFAPLVDYLCVIQLREISPCVLPRPVLPYSYVWSSLDSKGAVS